MSIVYKSSYIVWTLFSQNYRHEFAGLLVAENEPHRYSRAIVWKSVWFLWVLRSRILTRILLTRVATQAKNSNWVEKHHVRFYREILLHPRLPDILLPSYWPTGGSVEGLLEETLLRLPKERPVLKEPKPLDCLCDVLSALQFLHERGMVHNDVKGSSTILLSIQSMVIPTQALENAHTSRVSGCYRAEQGASAAATNHEVVRGFTETAQSYSLPSAGANVLLCEEYLRAKLADFGSATSHKVSLIENHRPESVVMVMLCSTNRPRRACRCADQI